LGLVMVLQHDNETENPRAVIGNNSGTAATDIVNVSQLENVLRICRAEYNQAAQSKRHANEKIRDLRNDFKVSQAEQFETINAILTSAREKLAEKLRTLAGYVEAEEDKRDASLRMKAALKKLKDAGGDPQAFKIMNKLGDMDAVEREEFFDRIDMYCKAMRLWGADY
jgi:BMFP domain-containing protein YqiC